MSRNRPFQGPPGFVCDPYPIGFGSFGEVYLAKRPPRTANNTEDAVDVPSGAGGGTLGASGGDGEGGNASPPPQGGGASNATEKVAIKRVSDFANTTQLHCADQQSFLRRICREVSNLKHFSDCPHVVEIQDIYFSDDGLDLYLVMTAYSLSLEQFVSNPEHTQMKDALDENHVRWIMCQVLCGLYEIHQAGCMHRDLTLNNLLLDLESFECVISDFGLSRVQLESDPMISLTVASLPYRAPEIILESRPYTNALDIWSAGCILVQLLSKSSIMRIGGEQEDVVAQLWTIMETVCGLPTEEELDYWEHERNAAHRIVGYLRAQRQRAERAKFIRATLQQYDERKSGVSDAADGTATAEGQQNPVVETEDSINELKIELQGMLEITPRFPEKRDIGEELILECSKNPNPTPPSDAAINLARVMLVFDPAKRATTRELLQMPWFQEDPNCAGLVADTLSNQTVGAKDETQDLSYEEMIKYVRSTASI